MRRLFLLFLASFHLIQAGKPFFDYVKTEKAAQEAIDLLQKDQPTPQYWRKLCSKIESWNVDVNFTFEGEIITAPAVSALCVLKKTEILKKVLKIPTTDPNARDKRNNTPLHLFLTYNTQENPEEFDNPLDQLLLHPKTNLNATNSCQETPIMIAAWTANAAAFIALYSHGACLYATDIHGFSVKDYTERSGILSTAFFNLLFPPIYPERISATPMPNEVEEELARLEWDQELETEEDTSEDEEGFTFV